MLIRLYDSAELIKVNKLEEITSPILFDRGMPSSTGLLSTDIFGNSARERKNTYAYIDLHTYFLQPFIYKLLKRMNRSFEHIVHSTRKYKIDNGKLVEDENGNTGIGWLYSNWEKINFEKNNSLSRNDRIDVIKAYKKNVLFTKYCIVLPAFYRDVNLQSVGKGEVLKPHEINGLYSKLIRYTQLLENKNSFDFVLDNTMANIQLTLVEIYDELKTKVEKKHGFIRKNLLGKSIDYGVRTVISAPTFHAKRPEEMIVDSKHTGVPLAQCCTLFLPFLMPWLKNYFKQKFEQQQNKFPVIDASGDITTVELDSPELFYSEEFLKKQIDNFVFSAHNRFIPIEVPVKGTTKKYYMRFIARDYVKGRPMDESPMHNRPAVWADVFYQAMVDITEDKVVYTTRYPVNDYFGTFPSLISVLSTQKTIPFYVDETVYVNYPDIEYYMGTDKESTAFIDTSSFSNIYCTGLGADFDGDQVSHKGLYSQEANEEAKEQMLSKKHILNINGESMRQSSNEAIQSLYALTRFDNSVS